MIVNNIRWTSPQWSQISVNQITFLLIWNVILHCKKCSIQKPSFLSPRAAWAIITYQPSTSGQVSIFADIRLHHPIVQALQALLQFVSKYLMHKVWRMFFKGSQKSLLRKRIHFWHAVYMVQLQIPAGAQAFTWWWVAVPYFMRRVHNTGIRAKNIFPFPCYHRAKGGCYHLLWRNEMLQSSPTIHYHQRLCPNKPNRFCYQ